MATMAAASPSIQRPRRSRLSVDTLLLAAVLVLLVIGLLATYTASYPLAEQVFGDGSHFLKRQLLWATIGLVAMMVMLSVDYRFWQRHSVLIMAGTLLILVGILAVGAQRFGGQRWVIGGGSVQPSELAKLAVIIYVADWLAGKQDDIRDITLGLVPFAILIGFVCGLILLQPDFSTAVLIGLIATAMFFAAGADLIQMLLAGTAATGVLVALIIRAPYRLERLRVFLSPESASADAGFQVRQTLQSIMRGGLMGVGLGEGQQKQILPAPHTDAIFAVLGEEIGMLGCLIVLCLFAVIAWRGLRIAAGSVDPFAALLAVGVACWITLQALLNVAGVTAVAPLSGIPLPFLSFGGSSLVMCLAGVGLLLNLSRHIDTKQATLHADLDLRRGNRRSRLSRAHRSRRLDQ
jgi:cell division protein FtsW